MSEVEARLEEIEARAEAATPPPWNGESDGVQYADPNVKLGWLPDKLYHGYEAEMEMADVEFISHAREDVPFLLAQVRVLRGALMESSEALHRSHDTEGRSLKACLATICNRSDAALSGEGGEE